MRKKLKQLYIMVAVVGLGAGVVGGLVVLLLFSMPTSTSYVEMSSLVEATEAVSPSVVNITATNDQGQRMGSGFILKNNLVLTNHHVFNDPEASYTVALPDGREFRVSDFKFDPLYDVALLTLQDDNGDGPTNLPNATLGDSTELKAGQRVIAIGSSEDASPTVVSGIISAVNRSITAQDIDGNQSLVTLIQTDAPIYPGNSGGPLVSLDGKVVGMNVAVATNLRGIAFAIPVNDILRIVENLQ